MQAPGGLFPQASGLSCRAAGGGGSPELCPASAWAAGGARFTRALGELYSCSTEVEVGGGSAAGGADTGDQRSTILAVDNCKGIKFKGRTVSESTTYPATAPVRLQRTCMTAPESSRRRSVGFRPPHPVHLKAPTTKYSPNNVNKKNGKEDQGEDCCMSERRGGTDRAAIVPALKRPG